MKQHFIIIRHTFQFSYFERSAAKREVLLEPGATAVPLSFETPELALEHIESLKDHHYYSVETVYRLPKSWE